MDEPLKNKFRDIKGDIIDLMERTDIEFLKFQEEIKMLKKVIKDLEKTIEDLRFQGEM